MSRFGAAVDRLGVTSTPGASVWRTCAALRGSPTHRSLWDWYPDRLTSMAWCPFGLFKHRYCLTASLLSAWEVYCGWAKVYRLLSVEAGHYMAGWNWGGCGRADSCVTTARRHGLPCGRGVLPTVLAVVRAQARHSYLDAAVFDATHMVRCLESGQLRTAALPALAAADTGTSRVGVRT